MVHMYCETMGSHLCVSHTVEILLCFITILSTHFHYDVQLEVIQGVVNLKVNRPDSEKQLWMRLVYSPAPNTDSQSRILCFTLSKT